MFCCLLLNPAFGQQLTREEITSAYIYNFAKNIEWKNEGALPEFHFLLLSDDKAVNRELSNLSASRKLKGKPIRVTVSESAEVPRGVQLIFISRGKQGLGAPVFRRIEGKNVLLVTEGIDDKRITMINLLETEKKTIKFEINKANIINQGLKVLPDMVLLGGTEVDVAKLYKETQDTLRSKDVKIASLRQHLDSLGAQIAESRKVIDRQNLLIERQGRDILGQQDQMERQRDTLSKQAGRLDESQRALRRQQETLERQQSEIDEGRTVLSDQREKIDKQEASILKQRKVLKKLETTIVVQEIVQRFLILVLVLVLVLSFTLYRSYVGKKLANMRLEGQERQIKRLNEELLERASALEAANKELEAFSYSVSHDLRAPLRSIDGFSQAILEDYEGEIDDRGKDYLRRVRVAAQRMAGLIDDMLSLSRVVRSEMAVREVDLSALAAEVAGKFREQQPGRRVEISIQPGITVMGDGQLLRIVLENLFDNAWKYTSRHPAARIEFGARDSGRKRVCYVRDDGAGFDMKYAQKLFGAFQRMHSSEEFPGTGVGLATVQRIIHRHGGRIWAESEVEKGATFYFSLPGKENEDGEA